jgi:hypothetical protein
LAKALEGWYKVGEKGCKSMDLSFLLMFVNSSKIGGWTRAGVAAGLTALIAKWPFLSQYLAPDTQAEVAAAASGIVVAVWSHFAKSLSGPTLPVAAQSLASPTAGVKA